MNKKTLLDLNVGAFASIKNVSGWAVLKKYEMPDMPDIYSIGVAYYGHIFTVELVKSLELTEDGLVITLKS